MSALPRRSVLAAVAMTLALPARAAKTAVQVWKSPGCGCCEDWVSHLEAAGFTVRVHDEGLTEARERLKMPLALTSCHRGEVRGFAIEGHVPAREIQRLLAEKPDAIGLAVPGMPVGSPGMEGPDGAARQPHDVLLVLRDGRSRIFQSYR